MNFLKDIWIILTAINDLSVPWKFDSIILNMGIWQFW